MKDYLFNALFHKGFVSSAAMDIATLLEKTLLRADSKPSKKDINDIIAVLSQLRDDSSLINS